MTEYRDDATSALARAGAGNPLQQLGVGERIDLAQPGLLWLVESGRVEVYYAERHRVHGVGTRRFLLEAEAGEVVASMGCQHDDLDVEVFAMGSGARVRPIQGRQFLEWLKASDNRDAADALLATWINRLSSRLVGDRPPSRLTLLPSHGVANLSVSQRVGSGQHLQWIAVLTGSCSLADRDDLNLRNGEVWPIAGNLWCHSSQAETTLQVFSTAAALSEGQDLVELVMAFDRRVLEAIVADDRTQLADEGDRLRAKADEESRLAERSDSLLAQVLKRRRPGGAGPVGLATSPLVAVTQLVGREIGLEIEPPPDAGRGRLVHIKDPLQALARGSKIRVRKIVLRGEWWKQDNGPLVGHVEADGRPVALVQSRRSRYVMHDPTNDFRQHVTPEVAATLRPIAYMLFPSFGRERLTPKSLWRMGLRGVGRDLTFVMLLSATTALMALATPVLSQILFDEIVPQADRSQLPVIATVLLVFAIVSAALGLVRGLVLLRVEAKVEVNTEAALMDRLLRLPAAFFKRYLTGDLAQRVLGIAAIRRTLTGATLSAILNGIFSLVSLGLLFHYNATLALLGTVLAILAVSVIVVSSLIALQYSRRLTEWAGEISGLVLQLMSSISKLRIAAAEERAFGVWAEKFAQQRRYAYRAGEVQNYFETFQAAYPVITSMFFFGVIYVVTERTVGNQGAVTAGVFIAVIGAFSQFLGGMLGLGSVVISVLNVVPYYERLIPILEAEPEMGTGRIDPGRLSGDIEIDHLTFRYAADGPVVLEDLSLKVRRGEMVALVGPSGSGKSTLIRLLLGFEQPESGTIYYDGRDLAGLDLDSLRQQLGVVPQHGQLVQGDVLSNIIGPWDLSQEEAWAALKAVGLEEDVRAMPMGVHTLVSEDGGMFSGGQKQRLMIARAIVHDPAVLLLDEATSALDNRSQRVVSESLKRMNVTRVVIAHRLSTIQEADRIYVLEAGRIVESGTYESLWAKGGQFAELARRQLA